MRTICSGRRAAGAVLLSSIVVLGLVAACGSSSSDGSAPGLDASHADTGQSRSDSGGGGDTGGGQDDADTIPTGGDSGAGCDGTCTIAFASDSTWATFSGELDGSDASTEGPAKPVCYNDTSPPNCPPGAVVYGFAGSVAQQSLASIPGALWVWRGDVAADADSDLVVAIFKKTFTLGASPAGSIQISVDDFADVRVNGVSVGTIGSTTDSGAAGMANSQLTTFDLTPQLHAGDNTITVIAQNGPASFAGSCTTCTYSQNPAALVFGGTLSYH